MAATNTFSKQVMWHDDGDIVLVCGGSAAFRVHLDVLAAQSNIFKHMAQIPQPRQVCYETYQDCPVIRLHDALEDLQRFIKAIYELQWVHPYVNRYRRYLRRPNFQDFTWYAYLYLYRLRHRLFASPPWHKI